MSTGSLVQKEPWHNFYSMHRRPWGWPFDGKDAWGPAWSLCQWTPIGSKKYKSQLLLAYHGKQLH